MPRSCNTSVHPAEAAFIFELLDPGTEQEPFLHQIGTVGDRLIEGRLVGANAVACARDDLGPA